MLVNEQSGTIDANGQLTLTIDNDSPGSADTQPSNAVINTGTIEATGIGGLAIVNTTISNASDAAHNTGIVEVAAGSQITLDNATILHGSVTIAASGEMQTASGTTNTIDTAEGQDNLSTPTLINAGTLLVNDNSSLTLASPDAIDNSGTITLSSTGDATYLYFDQADAGINGGGHIILSDSTANIIAVTQSGDQLTNFDNTISGAGTIGTGGMVLVNDSVINANQQNAALTLDPMSLTNTGTLEATGGGTLVISDTTVSNVPYSFSTLTDPAAPSNTGASGINDADQIVGTYISSGKSSGFLYDGGNYITLDDPAATGGTSANAINDAGEVVGTYTDATGAHGFLFSNGSYSTLNDPSATNGTFAEGINDAGQVVGHYDASGSSHGFLRSGSTYITLDDPLGTFGTSANGINDAGEVVGTYTDATGAHGFLYNNGTYTTLNDPLAANGTFAEGINDAGQVVGYYLNSSDVAHGFVYSNGTYFKFDNSAAGTGVGEGTFAFAINNAGQVSGYYVGGGFDVAGFLATPAQSPTSGSIFADSGATVDLVGTSIVGGNVTTAAATNTDAAGLIDVTGNAISAVYDATVSNAGAFSIEQGSQLDVSGTAFTGGSLIVAGILDSTGTSAIAAAAITVTGTLEVTAGALTIDPGTLDNSGALDVTAGTLKVENDVSGGGAVAITGGGIADFTKIFNENVTFGVSGQPGAGTLELAQSYGGTISNFGANDLLDLTNLGFSPGEHVVWQQGVGGGTLAIYNGSTLEETIKLAGSYVPGNFALERDSSGNTEVAYQTASPTGDEWINPAGGSWSDQNSWSNGVPVSTTDAVIGVPGTYAVTLSGNGNTAHSLTISDADATLTGGGTLAADTIDNSGTIAVTVDPTLSITANAVINKSGATIESVGSGSSLTITELANGSENFGTIAALDGGSLTIDRGDTVGATNESKGTIEACGDGSTLILNNNLGVANDGIVKAAFGGTVTINIADTNFTGDGGNHEGGLMEAISGGTLAVVGDMFNAGGATIKADGLGSTAEFSGGDYFTVVTNDGSMLATHQGTMSFDSVTIYDSGNMTATDGGTMVMNDVVLHTEPGGTLTADGGTIVANLDNYSWNYGTNEATDGGTLIVNIFGIDTGNSGLAEADHGGTYVLNLQNADHDPSGTPGGNYSTIEALASGTVCIIGDINNESSGTIEAAGFGSLVTISDSHISNAGIIAAEHRGLVSIDDSTLDGGTLQADGGAIFVSGGSAVAGSIDVSITGGGLVDIESQVGSAVSVGFGSGDSHGSGTFALDQTTTSGSTISLADFGVGDTLDLKNLPYTANADTEHFTVTSGDVVTLTVTDGDASESFTLTGGSYNSHNLTAISDPWGGTDVVFGTEVVWTGESNGDWSDSSNWNDEHGPDENNTAVIVTSGTYVTVDDSETVGNLVIGNSWESGQLDIAASGSLTVLNALDDGGTIKVDGTDASAYLQVDGPARVESGAGIDACGSGATVDFHQDAVGNAGEIGANDGATVKFDGATVWNLDGAIIDAMHGGAVEFSDATVYNASTIAAYGSGSEVDLSSTTISGGTLATGDPAGGTCGIIAIVTPGEGGANTTVFDGSDCTVTVDAFVQVDAGANLQLVGTIDNTGGTIAAYGAGSVVELSNTAIFGGSLETSDCGLIETVCSNSTFDDLTISTGSEVQVNDHTSLTLQGMIDNAGTITVGSGDPDLVIDGEVCLEGTGNIVLSGSGDNIIGATWSDNCNVLINYNDISGAGQIGDCSSDLTLINTSCGVINANVSGETLTINTGNLLSNAGTLEASNGGTLLINDSVSNSGGGNALIEGGILDFVNATTVDEITFNNGSTPKYGELVLGDPQNSYSATVNGFNGMHPILTASDGIDLAGTWTTSSSLTGTGGNLVVGLTDGHGDAVTFTFTDFSGTLNVGSDGGTGTLITDPPKAGSTSSSVAVDGAGNDTFIFHPGMGAETATNFNPKADSIELDHFANIESVQQLASLITTDAQGDAVLALGHHDSITLPGTTASYLQAHLHNLVHLN